MATFLDRFRQNLPVDTSTSSLFPSFDQWMANQGYTFFGDEPDATGMGWAIRQNDVEGDYWQRAGEDMQDQWASQYDNVYANSMRNVQDNADLSKTLYGTAGMIAPGYYPGYYGGLQSRLYSPDEMFGRFGPMGNLSFGSTQDRLGLTPEQLALRSEFEQLFPGYSQLTSDQYTIGADGRIQFKTAGPSMGQYIIDPNQLKYDERFGLLSPLTNLGASGSKGGWSDTIKAFAPMALMALGANFLGPATGGVEGAGGGAFGGDIAGTAFAGEGLSGGLGGGMGFFDDILGLASDQGFLPGSFDLGESLYGGTAAQGLDFASAESWLRNLVGGGLPSLGNSLMNLLGGGSGTGSNNLLGGLFGGTGGGFNPAAIAAALAAINYAKNTDPFDTSRLESLYGQFNPSANAFQYDTNTGLGREELTSGLARRGISGSSFGDQSLTNYNTFRDLGRQSLLNQGIGTQADIASKILSSDVASRQMKNDLYGRALLALSGGLSPTNTSAFFGR